MVLVAAALRTFLQIDEDVHTPVPGGHASSRHVILTLLDSVLIAI